MYCIIIHHFYYLGNGLKKYFKFEKELKILEIIIFWHIDGFALISGIVGYKTNKYSNLLYLWFCVFFYSIAFHYYFKKFRPNSIIEKLSIEFFPMIYRRYWYFTAYFGMYLFLPLINKGISILTKSELKIIVISTLGIFVFWRELNTPEKDAFCLNGGTSPLWLLTFYITGAYIGKYRRDYSGIKKVINCLICLFMYVISTFIYYKSYKKELYIGNKYYLNKIIELLYHFTNERYDSLIKTIQSISISLFFLQIKYNKYLSKIISFFGQHTFGIYLIHVNNLVYINIFSTIFKNEPYNLGLFSIIILFLVKGLKVFFICIFIDYLRYLLFALLKIRKVCIFLEKLIFKILG